MELPICPGGPLRPGQHGLLPRAQGHFDLQRFAAPEALDRDRGFGSCAICNVLTRRTAGWGSSQIQMRRSVAASLSSRRLPRADGGG